MANGAPGTDFEVVDLSVLLDANKKGIALVAGITPKGKVNTPIKIRSWVQFRRELMGNADVPDFNQYSLFPLLCKRALDGGAVLIVSRMAHYTDITNASTLEGTKASGIIQGVALTTVSITGLDQTGGAGTNFFTLATDLTAKFIAGTTFTVTGSTGNDSTYTVVSSVFGTDTDIMVAEAIADATVDGDINYSADFVKIEADSIGTGSNGISIAITTAESGTANKLDYAVVVPQYDELAENFRNEADAPTTGEQNRLNAASRQINLALVEGTIPTGTIVLAGGEQVYANIIDVDYVGNDNAKLGIKSFNDTIEGVRIAVPELANPTVDTALVTYAELKKIKAFIRTPLGSNKALVLDYRDGTGSYSHGAFNSWHNELWTGGIKVNNTDTDNVELEIPCLGDILGLAAKTDRKQEEWFSFSGPKRGRVKDGQGVVQNFGNPVLEADFAELTEAGVNCIIEHPNYGTVAWGNRTTWKDRTLLQAANVADLILAMRRLLNPLFEKGMFDPNDPDLWKELYNEVFPALDDISDKRGIHGKEGVGYLYLGDQNVDTVEDVVINTTGNLDLGRYLVKIFVKPIRATEFILIKLVITNSGADFTVTSEQPPV